jgi:hypothetical protein
MPVVNHQLVAPTDQARCGFDDGTTFTVSDQYVRIGRFDGSATEYTGGIVMPLDVPQGATINSATLQFYNINIGQTLGKTVRVYADSALTQANFSSSDHPSDAALTTAFASITNPTITDNTAWATINIASVIAEIVANGSWVQNNLIRFIIVVNAPGAYQSNDINGAGVYSDTSNEPSFSIDYTAGGAATGRSRIIGGKLVGGILVRKQ